MTTDDDVPSAGGSARIGIVLRTKNRPTLLKRALADIAAQSCTDWRVHVVNDGGDAAHVDAVVAEAPAAVRERCTVTHHAVPHGRSAAANVGVRGVDAEYLVLHDDDDRWDPDFLELTSAWLDANPDHAGVAVRTEIVYETEREGGFAEVGRAPFWPGQRYIAYSDLLQRNRFVPIAYLYRSALHAEVGLYREDVHAAEDWEFNLRVAQRHPIGYLPDRALAFWHQRAGVEGDLGNSMFALAADHDLYDMMVRDEALRGYVAEHGPGLPLYLARYVQDEVARQLDERRTLGQVLTAKARTWLRERRMR
ncbi:glycosyltransferase family 2 protein [Microbacterium sp. 22303]|uniref:glycosyltransferase family 2 protein n=1 Tax=Microbacterium sp. 22303 TaxID=3453905 RepID=UPI003F830A17